MARIKRKRIQFTEESLNEFYQEVYNDSYNFRAQVTAVISRWSPMVKDEGNIAAMGDKIVALLNAIAKTNDQKIILLKVLKDIVQNKKEDAPKQTSGDAHVSISDEAKQELMRMAEEMRRGIENTNEE